VQQEQMQGCLRTIPDLAGVGLSKPSALTQ
jgi:hypothetical protein